MQATPNRSKLFVNNAGILDEIRNISYAVFRTFFIQTVGCRVAGLGDIVKTKKASTLPAVYGVPTPL